MKVASVFPVTMNAGATPNSVMQVCVMLSMVLCSDSAARQWNGTGGQMRCRASSGQRDCVRRAHLPSYLAAMLNLSLHKKSKRQSKHTSGLPISKIAGQQLGCKLEDPTHNVLPGCAECVRMVYVYVYAYVSKYGSVCVCVCG